MFVLSLGFKFEKVFGLKVRDVFPKQHQALHILNVLCGVANIATPVKDSGAQRGPTVSYSCSNQLLMC